MLKIAEHSRALESMDLTNIARLNYTDFFYWMTRRRAEMCFWWSGILLYSKNWVRIVALSDQNGTCSHPQTFYQMKRRIYFSQIYHIFQICCCLWDGWKSKLTVWVYSGCIYVRSVKCAETISIFNTVQVVSYVAFLVCDWLNKYLVKAAFHLVLSAIVSVP